MTAPVEDMLQDLLARVGVPEDGQEDAQGAPQPVTPEAVHAQAAVLGDCAGDALLAREVDRLERQQRAREIVARRMAEAAQGGKELPRLESFDALWDRTPEVQPWRVEGLLTEGASMLITGQAKAGKTLATVNLVHALLTGEDYLGHFPVVQPEHGVVMLNFELTAHELVGHLKDRGVTPELAAGRLHIIDVRGRANPFADTHLQADLAAAIRATGAEVIVVDPFSVAYPGESENDAREVRSWLDGLDRWVRQDCGASELVLVNHAGHNGTRSRGSTAMEDWYTARMLLEYESAGDQRKASWNGRRGVETWTQVALTFDRETGAQVLDFDAPRTPKAARTNDDERHLVDAVRHAGAPIPESGIQDALRSGPRGKGMNRDRLPLMLEGLQSRGVLDMTEGERGAKLWQPGPALGFYLGETPPVKPTADQLMRQSLGKL